MSTMTVFGGTGYAGRHIVDEAARRGHQVIAVSRSAGDADGGAEITWTSADVTDAEAVRAATLGGALGLRAQDRVGSLEVGKRADLHVLDAPAAIHLAYRPGMPLTHAVWRAGRRAV